MINLCRYADDVLHQRVDARRQWRDLLPLVAVMVFFGAVYGAVMGSFSVTSPERSRQAVYGAVKVPLLLALTFLLSLPSFFVVNTLAGLRRDFGRAVQVVVTAQAGVAVVLASLAPLTAVWYLSSADYQTAVLYNAAMFTIASLAGQHLIRRDYQLLIARNRRHALVMWGWIAIYAVVGIQMSWVLRPFVGSAAAPVQFFRDEAWDNAYVVVARLVWNVLTR